MNETEYRVAIGDTKKKAEIEHIKVFCPKCGEKAKLIWSVTNEGLCASWHCSCQATEQNGWRGWWTAAPEPFKEKPQRFKTLFDL